MSTGLFKVILEAASRTKTFMIALLAVFVLVLMAETFKVLLSRLRASLARHYLDVVDEIDDVAERRNITSFVLVLLRTLGVFCDAMGFVDCVVRVVVTGILCWTLMAALIVMVFFDPVDAAIAEITDILYGLLAPF